MSLFCFFRPGALWLARAWFLRIASVRECLFVCVCVSAPRLLITSSVMCDIAPYDWLNKFYGFYMAAVVGIDSGCDVSIYMRRGN